MLTCKSYVPDKIGYSNTFFYIKNKGLVHFHTTHSSNYHSNTYINQNWQYTLYYSHRIGAIKSVEETIEDGKKMKIWDQKIYNYKEHSE